MPEPASPKFHFQLAMEPPNSTEEESLNTTESLIQLLVLLKKEAVTKD